MDETEETLERLIAFMCRHIGNKPEVLAEAGALLNEFIFHGFSDVRNKSMEKVRSLLNGKQRLLPVVEQEAD